MAPKLWANPAAMPFKLCMPTNLVDTVYIIPPRSTLTWLQYRLRTVVPTKRLPKRISIVAWAAQQSVHKASDACKDLKTATRRGEPAPAGPANPILISSNTFPTQNPDIRPNVISGL